MLKIIISLTNSTWSTTSYWYDIESTAILQNRKVQIMQIVREAIYLSRWRRLSSFSGYYTNKNNIVDQLFYVAINKQSYTA